MSLQSGLLVYFISKTGLQFNAISSPVKRENFAKKMGFVCIWTRCFLRHCNLSCSSLGRVFIPHWRGYCSAPNCCALVGIKPGKIPWPSGLQLVWGSTDTGEHRARVLSPAKLFGHLPWCKTVTPPHDLFSFHISVQSCVKLEWGFGVKPAWEGCFQLIFSHKGKQLPWGCVSISQLEVSLHPLPFSCIKSCWNTPHPWLYW